MKSKKLALVLIAIVLTGCATVRQIDNDVRTQSTLKSVPVAGYRFERLPSQQTPAQAPAQAALEGMAEQALSLVGLKRDDARPGYSMLIGATLVTAANSLWNDPWYGPTGMSMTVGFGSRGRGRGGFGGGIYYGPGFGRYGPPLLHREVSLLMRDLSTGQVVYETRAVHDGPWTDDNNILPLMFQAAVSGFPVPPTELRRVNILLHPTQTSSATDATPTR